MKRSEFLRLSCTGCLLAAAGLGSMSSLLSSCSPATGGALSRTPVVNGKLEVPLAGLQAEGVTIVRGKGLDFDIALHKTADGSYVALLLQCTHFSNPVVPQAGGYHCNAHGSEFDADGKVRRGPASRPLKKLPLSLTDSALVISVS